MGRDDVDSSATLPTIFLNLGDSPSGKAQGFDPCIGGSNPSSPAKQ